MKRSQMYKKVNRRNNVFTHLNRNVVYPSLFLSSDEINKQGSVEIIELKSDEEPEKEQLDKSSYSHVWCYESDDQELSYRINKEARERRRRRIEYDNDEIYNELLDQMCTNFYGIDCHNSHDGTPGHRDAKCFTIINNHLSYSTSSDDDEEAEYSDTILNGNGTEEFDDNVNYNNGYAEKRTVWIYSEKNKKELSDDYDFKNISNKNSTSSSTDNDDPIRDISIGCIRRLATPIPTYIPKLFLPSSPKLPTVTEVLESYNRSSSTTEVNRSTSMTPQMPINNWVLEQPVENETDPYHKENNKTFTWDALSPREKRRLKNSMNEEKRNIDIDQKQTAIVNQSALANENIIEAEIEHQINDTSSRELNLKDSSLDEMNKLQKPQIKLNRKIKPKSEIITEPLEKENGKWIGEEADETLDVYDYDLEQNDAARDTSDADIKSYNGRGKQFLVSNMSLLRPMEWTQYLPIAGSVPSLHLSFETDYEENKSWLIRLFDCFKCCKRYK